MDGEPREEDEPKMEEEDDSFGDEPTDQSMGESFEFAESNEQEIPAEQAVVSASNPQPVAMIPCLKGTMTYVGGIVYCKGRWAMSEQAHDIAQNTSEFEFKLVTADEQGSYFPVNGMYQGWFNLKQVPPVKGHLKVEDKEMKISFTLADDGTHAVLGEGHNKFGSFRLRGTLKEDGSVVMYREYYHLNPVPAATIPTPKRGKQANGEKKERASLGKKDEMTSPRESGGRVRKQSIFITEFHDPLARSKSNEALEKIAAASTPVASATATAAPAPEVTARLSLARSSSERAPRLNANVKRCADLLKDLCKHPQSGWFLEPVDHVALNLPDYPKVIKTPMDFSTIRANIDAGLYDQVHAFADDVRLVFRNALQYNALPDNLVNMAARELSSRFEERFRSLLRQVDPEEYVPDPRPLQRSQSMGSAIGKRGGRNNKEAQGVKFAKAAVGPRAGSYLPPAAMDGSAHTIMEMQRMMQAMQEEIKQLRATVKEKEVMQRILETKEAAMNPLTYEEKKTLINQIHALPPSKMEQVLDIIQRALPAGRDESESEIEVPLDALDTLTLRKLQHFIEENDFKQKKRPFATAPSTSRAGFGSAAKKTKRARPSSSAARGGDVMSTDHDADLLFDEDELLFAPDTFEDGQRVSNDSYTLDPYGEDASEGASGAASATYLHDADGGGHPGDDEDENLWSVAAAELRAKRPDIDSYG